MGEIWRSLTREQQRTVALAVGGVVLTLLAYLVTSTIVAVAVAAIYAYSVGRYRATHRPEAPERTPEAPERTPEAPERTPEPPPEPVTNVQPPSRPAAQRRVRPAPQTPLGRLFAERPAWSGSPVGPFEPTRRTPPEEQEPYDSH
jgi:hypothetical protein